MDFFHKGGGVRGNPKVLGHFLCTNNFGILGRKGGGVDQIQKLLGTFYPDFGKIWQQKVPQKFHTKISLRKRAPKDLFRRSP